MKHPGGRQFLRGRRRAVGPDRFGRTAACSSLEFQPRLVLRPVQKPDHPLCELYS